MKRIAIASLLATLGLAQAGSFTDYAMVRNVVPQYDRVSEPRQECSTETVVETRTTGHSYGGAIVGGIAGALIGSQLGGGHGKQATTAAGAAIGALTGDNLDNRDRPTETVEVPHDVQRCRTVQDVHDQLTGYRVTYEYQGQRYTTMMANDPGRRMPVRVSVDPMVQ